MPRKSSPSAPTQRLNFFSLPPEIRNEIYSYLAQTTTTVIHIRPPSHRKSKSRWPATPLSLACTCRALYAEFAPLFYATTAYRSYASQAYSVALWLETVKAWTGHAIQTIRVPKTLYCCRPHGDRIVKVGERGVLENEPREWKTVTWYRRKLRNAQAAAAAAAGGPEGGEKRSRTGPGKRRRSRKSGTGSDSRKRKRIDWVGNYKR